MLAEIISRYMRAESARCSWEKCSMRKKLRGVGIDVTSCLHLQ